MRTAGRTTRRTAVGGAVLALSALAYSIAASATRPFSAAANTLTAIPIAAVAVLAVIRWPLHPTVPVPPPPLSREDPAGTGGHPWRARVVLAAVVVGFELLEYLVPGSRGAHPTLSSMADAVDRSHGLKAVVFFGWLCLGVGIVCAGTPGLARAAPGASPRDAT